MATHTPYKPHTPSQEKRAQAGPPLLDGTHLLVESLGDVLQRIGREAQPHPVLHAHCRLHQQKSITSSLCKPCEAVQVSCTGCQIRTQCTCNTRGSHLIQCGFTLLGAHTGDGQSLTRRQYFLPFYLLDAAPDWREVKQCRH